MDPTNDSLDNCSNAHENLVRLRQHKDPKSVCDFYDKWIKDGDYDKHLGEDYNGPSICVASLVKHLGGKTDISVLDVGSGSGLVGEELRKHDIIRIDGVEPSDGMIAKAKEKKIYNKIFKIFFTENVDAIESNTYDAIVSSGAFGEGHIPPAALSEFARIVKPGGIFVIAAGKSGIENRIDSLSDEMKKLEETGQLQCLELKDIPTFYYGRVGTLFVCKITGE